MDEIWERAVETALDGVKDHTSARTLTLDGAVKCVQGRLPPPSLLERFSNLEHLSIANVGVSSLEQFPKLWNLQRLILSDNRIAGGLEFLVEAGLDALRDLDLSNNRIQCVEDLAPLAQLKLVSLDLYECPVTRVKDYRARVFGLIKTLKYLDKMDAEENERPESDDEDMEEEEEEEEEEEDDPGSGEIDGEERVFVAVSNGHGDGVVDVDEEEESEADEEDSGLLKKPNGLAHQNGFRVEPHAVEEENDSTDEIDEEGDDDDDDVVEVYEIEDSDDDEEEEEEDGVEYDEDDEDEEEVDNDEGGLAGPESSGRLIGSEGEIDGHEQGEEDGDEDDDGETDEDMMGVDYDGEFEEEDEEEDLGGGYLVQPVNQSEALSAQDGFMNGGNDVGEEEEDDDDDNDDTAEVLPPTSSDLKRKRDDDDDDEQ